MTIKFTIEVKKFKKDSLFCELVYLNRRRFIQTSELANLSASLNLFVQKYSNPVTAQACPIKLELDTNQKLSIEDSQLEDVIEHLERGLEKKKITLDESLSRSIDGNYLVYTYRPLQFYSKYWEKETSWSNPSTRLTDQLFEQLSKDLIEIPYADDPANYEFRKNMIAFHTNHGTTYALRSAILMQFLCNLVREFGNKESNYDSFENAETLACLELAAFLFRSGRTNEYGWRGDLTYSPRGAAIFSQIAQDLGFDAALIVHIANAFNFKENIQVESRETQLFRKLFHIIHTFELIRCNTKKDPLIEEILLDLNYFFSSRMANNSIVDLLLEFTKSQCKQTGCPILIAEDRSFGNPYLAVLTANQAAKTYCDLKVNKEKWLPTASFLSNVIENAAETRSPTKRQRVSEQDPSPPRTPKFVI